MCICIHVHVEMKTYVYIGKKINAPKCGLIYCIYVQSSIVYACIDLTSYEETDNMSITNDNVCFCFVAFYQNEVMIETSVGFLAVWRIWSQIAVDNSWHIAKLLADDLGSFFRCWHVFTKNRSDFW